MVENKNWQLIFMKFLILIFTYFSLPNFLCYVFVDSLAKEYGKKMVATAFHWVIKEN